MMQEKIGNVVLDLEYYPGQDYYCDGDIEDKILDIVKNNECNSYDSIIEQENNWPILYHLSHLRGNIIEWLPTLEGAKVLEVGSGCGAITGTLASKCKELTCIDLSKKRSLINAYRNKNFENITIKVGNFQDIEPHLDEDYDVICLIGVFEYAAAYINSDKPYEEFLNIIKRHVKKGGNIVIAIENRMGLKYLAGCREDHLGDYFSGIEDYPKGGVVRTFTRKGLEQILRNTNTTDYSFYYPYPDYKFMHTLYSDRRLPNEGELSNNLRNFDRDRLLLFDEKNAFDSIIRDEEFPLFSNSYLLLIGPENEIIYSKYSNDRDEKYRIRTDIRSDKKELVAVKKALSDKAKEHICKIYEDGERLTTRFENSNVKVCKGKLNEELIYFPYLEGKSLEEILDGYLAKGDIQGFKDILRKYYEVLLFNKDCGITDYDLIFPNIIVNEDGWNVIDYEWSMQEYIEPADIFARALYCYRLGGDKRRVSDIDSLLKEIVGTDYVNDGKYSDEKLNLNEIKFQKTVTGQRASMSELRDSIHNEVMPLADSIKNYVNQENEKRSQIYIDKGNGFCEECSYYVTPKCEKYKKSDAEKDENTYIIEIKLECGIDKYRFDIRSKAGIYKILSTTVAGDNEEKEIPMKKVEHNGVMMKDGIYAFDHDDPYFVFDAKLIGKIMKTGADYIKIRYSKIG